MKKMTKIAAACLMLAGLQTADAQITRQGSGYLMRMKFSQGQSAKYNMTMATAMNGQQMNMSMPLTQTVSKVAKGIADVSFAVGPVSMNGKAMNNQVQKLQVSMDSRGKVVKGQSLGQTGTSVNFPEKPIRIGESWTHTSRSQAGMAGMMDVVATYTLVGVQSVGGRQVAKLNVKTSAKGQASGTGGGTMLISVSDGWLHSANIKMNMSIRQSPQGQPMKVPSTVKITRV